MAYEKQAMTTFAQQALALSDLIQMKFRDTRVSGDVTRVVKVQAPITESTNGGKQARESLVLAPESGDPNGAVVCGFVDVGLRAAEVRTFAALEAMHKRRHKTALDLSKADYERFVADLDAFLSSEGYVLKRVDEGEQQARAVAGKAKDERIAQPGSRMGLYVGIGLAILAVGAGAFFLFGKG